MASIEFDDSELRAVSAQLGAVGPAAMSKAVKVVRKSTMDVVRVGKRNAPVDTGNLRSSIHGNTHGSGLMGEAGPSADYGRYVEEGTSRMAPQPYMGPALDAVTPGFLEAMGQIAEETLE